MGCPSSQPEHFLNVILSTRKLCFASTTLTDFSVFLCDPNYVTFALWYGPSVVCISVTFVRPAQRVELFGDIFAPSNSLGTWAVCIKILGKIQRSSCGLCKLNIKGV